MEKYDIYKDIADRTGGDIYIGVVGPVRTGKSTFITRFMQEMVIPDMDDSFQRQIATDEMPQSADGKTIMTTQPKFVPANAVKVKFRNKGSANVRLIDCVGYFVDGATGNKEDDKPRLVKTPWSDKELPFETAAEIGTEKVIKDYSTIGIVVTTDGTIGDIPRDNYVSSEDRVIRELKALNKPFVVIMNSKDPQSEYTLALCDRLEKKYMVPVLNINVLTMKNEQISMIMEKVLLEFPMSQLKINMPQWMQCLSADNPLINEVIENIKSSSYSIEKMKDFSAFNETFISSDKFKPVELNELKLGEGIAEYNIVPQDSLYYNVLSEECGERIENDYELMNYIKTFSKEKSRYVKIKDALDKAEETGYGVVLPTVDEMELFEPELIKHGGQYGVKLKAQAPSLHIMKVDVNTEVTPTVGTEKQGEELVNSIMNTFQDNPQGIWDTNMFGKSLHELVREGLNGKLNSMPVEAQGKLRKTLTRIVNENKGGIICILL